MSTATITSTTGPSDLVLPLPRSLAFHLRDWAGHDGHEESFRVVAHVRNDRPGWSGAPNLLTGVIDPAGRATLAVPERHAARVTALVRHAGPRLARNEVVRVLGGVPDLLGRPGEHVERLLLRWTLTPVDLPAVGTWIAPDHPSLPAWLRPFGGPALCALDDQGRVLAGVGIKRHDRWAHELAVVTVPAARGRGLARRLIAQAARHLLDRGVVPTYLHHCDNTASARVAAAAGFQRTGWHALLLSSAT